MKWIYLALVFSIFNFQAHGQICDLDSTLFIENFTKNVVNISSVEVHSKRQFVDLYNATMGGKVLKKNSKICFYDLYIDSVYYTIARVRIRKEKAKRIKSHEGHFQTESFIKYVSSVKDNVLFVVFSNYSTSIHLRRLLEILEQTAASPPALRNLP